MAQVHALDSIPTKLSFWFEISFPLSHIEKGRRFLIIYKILHQKDCAIGRLKVKLACTRWVNISQFKLPVWFGVHVTLIIMIKLYLSVP